jgi:hypothetical protein
VIGSFFKKGKHGLGLATRKVDPIVRGLNAVYTVNLGLVGAKKTNATVVQAACLGILTHGKLTAFYVYQLIIYPPPHALHLHLGDILIIPEIVDTDIFVGG